MTLHIKAKPGSKVNQIIVADDGTVTVKIKAPAQDGKANDELVRFLAEKLGLAKSKVRIISGFTAPFKKLEIEGEEGAVRNRLSGKFK
jgi:uncharacterized protein (TIGR00251 family)